MLKKVIKFTDIEGNEAEETAYFNLTQIEFLRLSGRLGIKGDLQKGLLALVQAEDMDKMLNAIEDIILTSYGVRDSNTSGFKKSPALREAFSNSIPYSDFFISLLNDPEVLKEFAASLETGAKSQTETKETPKVDPIAMAQAAMQS